MLTQFTTPFIEAKDDFIAWAHEQDYPSYSDLLKKAIELINDRSEFGYGEAMDPERVHEISDGSYQGTILFAIGETGYMPSRYWTTLVDYGSCSGCDALEAAWGWGDGHDMEAVYAITLHMMQCLRPAGGAADEILSNADNVEAIDQSLDDLQQGRVVPRRRGGNPSG